MDEQFNVLLGHPQHLGIDQLSYGLAINVAMSCGLNPRFKSPLVALGKLRNKFAHKLDRKIELSDSVEMYNSFSTPDKKIIPIQISRLHIDTTAYEHKLN